MAKYQEVIGMKYCAMSIADEFIGHHLILKGRDAEYTPKIKDFLKEIDKWEKERQRLYDLVEQIQDPILKATFKEKYIHGKSWEQVAESIGYSVTHTQRIFKKALQDPEILKIKMELE